MSSLTSKARFAQTLFDRLAEDEAQPIGQTGTLRRLTADELKECVARDLEHLLNTRCADTPELRARFPQTYRSAYTYGLRDFTGLSLASPADRGRICRSLELAIARHEPRLRSVAIDLDPEGLSVNRLRFAIRALLVVHPAEEPVSFDALLQPSTLQYSVSRSRRGA